jgi:hypothetical protein
VAVLVRQDRGEAAHGLGRVLRHPEVLEAARELCRKDDLATRDGPVQRGADVSRLCGGELVALARAAHDRLDGQGERDRELRVVLEMPQADRVALAALVQPLGRELADRLEHDEALPAAPEEALVDERLEHVDLGVADGLRRVERAAAGEDAEPAKELLLLLV